MSPTLKSDTSSKTIVLVSELADTHILVEAAFVNVVAGEIPKDKSVRSIADVVSMSTALVSLGTSVTLLAIISIVFNLYVVPSVKPVISVSAFLAYTIVSPFFNPITSANTTVSNAPLTCGLVADRPAITAGFVNSVTTEPRLPVFAPIKVA